MENLIADSNSPESYFMEGRKAVYITYTTGQTGVVTLNGATVTAGAATVAALLTALNGVSGFLAIQVSTTVIFLTTISKAVNFSIAAGTGTAITKEGVYITGTNPMCKAKVQAERSYFNIVLQTIVGMNYAAASTAAQSTFNIYLKTTTGAKLSYTANTNTKSTAVTNINASAVNVGVFAYELGTVVFVSTLYGATATVTKISTNIETKLTYSYNWSGLGVYPNFTSDELYAEFAGKYTGMGEGVRRVLPIENAEYVVVNITKKGTSSTLTGSASGNEGYSTRIELVILKSLFFEGGNNSKTAGSASTLAAAFNSFKAGTIV